MNISRLLYLDTQAEAHVGDTVRYVRYDWATRGKFYQKTGTVTEMIGTGALGIHFPHHTRGTNLIAVDDAARLVRCTHGES